MTPKNHHFTHEDGVGLLDHVKVLVGRVEDKVDGVEKKLDIYKETSKEALDLAREVVDVHLRLLNENQDQIKALQIDKAELHGKVSQSAFYLSMLFILFGLFLSFCSLLTAFTGLALRIYGI